ncbi:MAG: hypothetical protein LBC41_02775 [Clostridiales bacterium]|nr:hypothetical protein [Clostridiales bacterium]
MANALLTKASEHMDTAAKFSGERNYVEALDALDKAEAILKRLKANEDVQQLVAKCSLDRGDIYWSYAESEERIKSNLQLMYNVVSNTLKYCDFESDMHMTWAKRVAEVCGAIIDSQEHVPGEVLSDYLGRNVMIFLQRFSLDESITIERTSRCVDLMKNLTQDKAANVLAQWLAGCAVLCLGKAEDKGRAARRVLDACRDMKQSGEKSLLAFVGLGMGCVADYHYEREEYELAEQRYQVALKYMDMVSEVMYQIHGIFYSEKIEECKKRMH